MKTITIAFIIKKCDTEVKTSVHDKKEILAFLKEDYNLAFVVEYIEKAKILT